MLAMTSWKSHCVDVARVRQVGVRWSGKISLHTFQEIGPRETLKENAKV
jgi:hypothetical protein